MNITKRVAVIKSEHSPFGGAEIMTQNFVHLLLNAGCEVTLLTSYNQEWPFKHNHLTIIELTKAGGNRFWQVWRFNRAVSSYLNKSRRLFDIVLSLDRVEKYTHYHAGGFCQKTSINLRSKESSKIRCMFRRISSFHNLVIKIEKNGFRQEPPPYIHCCSELIRKDIVSHYPKTANRTYIIPNWIDWEGIGDTYRHKNQTAQTLLSNASLPNKRFLLFIGGGFNSKGLDIAIKNLPRTHNLIVIGKGNPFQFKRIARKQGVYDRIHFLGPVASAWKFAAISEALLLPARYEPFGIVAAEANAMGIPVLVSNRTGYSDYIVRGKNGIVISDIDNYESIYKSFEQLTDKLNNRKNSFCNSDKIREQAKLLSFPLIAPKILRDFLGII